MGSSIAGLPDHRIENVSLSHLQFVYEGGGMAGDAARPIPEKAESYPEGWMFGTLPAWGLYCRHVRGLKLDHITLQLAAPDARHAVVFDDVEDLDVNALDCAFSPGAAPMVKMTAKHPGRSWRAAMRLGGAHPARGTLRTTPEGVPQDPRHGRCEPELRPRVFWGAFAA